MVTWKFALRAGIVRVRKACPVHVSFSPLLVSLPVACCTGRMCRGFIKAQTLTIRVTPC